MERGKDSALEGESEWRKREGGRKGGRERERERKRERKRKRKRYGEREREREREGETSSFEIEARIQVSKARADA